MSFRPFSPFRPGNSTDQQLGIQSTPSDLAAAATLSSPAAGTRGTEEAVDTTSKGVQFTDRGVEIADGSTVRAVLGDISAAKDGSAFGLAIYPQGGGPGGTVIIDGSSDMFRIAATGTHSVVANTGGSGTDTQTITGLGAWAGTPAVLSFISSSNAASANRHPAVLGDVQTLGGLWASTSAGIATNALFLALKTWAECHASLDGSSNAQVNLTYHNQSGTNFTFFERYYILQQTAI